MEDAHLRVDIARSLKEEAMKKAKAEGKSMKYVIEELLSSYVRGEQEQVQLTFKPSPRQRQQLKEEVQHKHKLTADDFDNYLEYVDYLERNNLLD